MMCCDKGSHIAMVDVSHIVYEPIILYRLPFLSSIDPAHSQTQHNLYATNRSRTTETTLSASLFRNKSLACALDVLTTKDIELLKVHEK